MAESTKTSEGYSVGPGVADAIHNAGDVPRSDEQYVILEEGHKVSMTFGRDAVYYYLQEDNAVRRTPFEWDVEEVPDGGLDWDPDFPMPPQYYGWTCSACSLDWVLAATGARGSDRYLTTMEIGYTENINPSYGLMDGSGGELQRVLADYGLKSEHAWLDFDTVYAIASGTTGMMSGQGWYHWVALRGVSGPNLWIANSAPGYKGVYDILTRADFDRLGGFSVVWLVED